MLERPLEGPEPQVEKQISCSFNIKEQTDVKSTDF